MIHFLWVEDFGGNNSLETTTKNIFKEISLDPFPENKEELREKLRDFGIYLELSLHDGLDFIRESLTKIDYIILDINLPCSDGDEEIHDGVKKILNDFYFNGEVSDDINVIDNTKAIKDALIELQNVAGFHLFSELIFNLGFPNNNICFCSNHGKELKSLKDSFKLAKIPPPNTYLKSEKEIITWVDHCRSNKYSLLRRGIIEGCDFLSALLEDQKDKLEFDNLISNKIRNGLDAKNYLSTLRSFLPQTEPQDKSSTYKLFIRALAHEWEAVGPRDLGPNSFSRDGEGITRLGCAKTMKMARNWITHGRTFDDSPEHLISYLFVVNMRAMFNLGRATQVYERYLFDLLENPIPQQDFENICNIKKKNRELKKMMSKSYGKLQNEYKKNALDYDFILNRIEQDKRTSDGVLKKGILQYFWYSTSRPLIEYNYYEGNERVIAVINFDNFNYEVSEWIKDISKHIYNYTFKEEN